MLRSEGIETALERVGALLALESVEIAIVIVGGAALNLRGLVARPTADVDIIAFAETTDIKQVLVESRLFTPPEPLPASVLRAATQVATDMGLDEHWLNSGPSLQMKLGLPTGFEGRIQWRHFGSLNVGIAGRSDLIALKLFAAVDNPSPKNVHYQDLLAMNPTHEELTSACAWVTTQDASQEFPHLVDEVAQRLRANLKLA